VTGDRPGVRWRVSAGRISSAGRYVAPAAPPDDGTVTIRATSATGAFGETTVRILPAPPRTAAPSPPGRPAALGGRHAPVLATPTLARAGRLVVIRTSTRRAGRLRISVLRGARTLGRCEARTPARRAVACRLRLPRATRSRALTVVLALRVRGRVVAARHVRFGRPDRTRAVAAGLICWLPA
jgi:hypothetical protein